MSEIKSYIKNLLVRRQIIVAEDRRKLFEDFVANETNCTAVQQILDIQKMLMDKWELQNRIADIQQQPVSIPNGTVGKRYEAILDFKKLGWDDIAQYELAGLELPGLDFIKETNTITGTPAQSGDLKITFRFRLSDEPEDTPLKEKQISLIINPDPKTLWKNIDSDRTDPFWKEDNIAAFDKLGDKHIVVASKRGRSHATVGSFRDDDFAYKYYEATGWSIVVVADGAGSAKLSRQGSKIACKAIVDFFTENFNQESLVEFDQTLLHYKKGTGEGILKKLSHFTYNHLSKAAYSAHLKLAEAATETGANLKDFHSTLIFTLFKKYEFGYALLSFGVGDCPIAVLDKGLSEVTLMNWLDVGDFGGGTRFITMPEIFKDDKFSTRFKFKLMDDFAYLVLMTDGIYDPKFVVEANLEKIEKWKEFMNDLQGNNENNDKVELDAGNKDIASQLSTWMDFWSAGNHDDRTLAIVF
ncbi:MAG: hypothetical protein JWP81_4103 [Ferruginibacter sp.]|nr:hypothetical protein [Ferruginibacter sp.]